MRISLLAFLKKVSLFGKALFTSFPDPFILSAMKMDWVDRMLPVMQKIRDRFHETVGLAVLDEASAVGVIVTAVPETGRFGFTLCTGHRFPVHTGAPAKAMLAFMPKERVEPLLKKVTFERFTKTTVNSLAAFRKELAVIRACGYALDRAEEVEGCHCLAVPVFDHQGDPVAGIWFTGPSYRLPLEKLPSAYPVLRALVDEAQRVAFAPLGDRGGAVLTVDKIGRARAILEAFPLTENMDLVELARSLGMSYSAFRHAFKAQTGASPAQFRLTRRIAAACRDLEMSALPLARIAEQTGFPSAAHFSTVFKKKTGFSPRDYRALNRRQS